MASEIRVNQIQSRTGVSTVSFTDTGPIFAGVSTVQGSLTVDENLNVGGSIVGNLNVTGVLTYDDVTNVDSIGIVTARSGINIGVSGAGDNTYIDNLTNGHLNIINSGRQANNGRVRINKTNSASGDTTYFRDFEVYDGKDKLLFLIDGSEARIGVGTDTFNDAAEVMRVQAAEGQNNTLFTIKANSTSGYCALNFGDDDFNEGRIIYQHSDNTMRFRVDDTERVRINDSNTLFQGRIHINSTDGGFDYNGIAHTLEYIVDNTAHSELNTGAYVPATDNTKDLGQSSKRWDDVYATNGSINTSDRNEKQQIRDLSTAELAVAQGIKSLIKAYKFNSSVEENGDSARIHVGVIAQDVATLFSDNGLDAADYGLWCSDTWYELDGKVVTADTEGAVERTRTGVRYNELLAFVVATL